MKKRQCMLLCMLCCLLSISGCGNESILTSSDVINTTSLDSNSSGQSNEFDSYIIYSVDADVNEHEFEEVTDIIKFRAMEGLSSYNRKVDADYEKREIKLEFNYDSSWANFFVEVSARPNLLEFRKGASYTSELVLNNNDIIKATSTYDESTMNWAVIVEFNDAGKYEFAMATEEIQNSDTPISIWLDQELIYAPLVREPITDGKAVITGNFSQQSAEELAMRINFTYLPYDVSVKDYSLFK